MTAYLLYVRRNEKLVPLLKGLYRTLAHIKSALSQAYWSGSHPPPEDILIVEMEVKRSFTLATLEKEG